ncbi:hypothetical protein E2562_017724 [Oryza meyeriana var. granulata]|uniref:Protein TIFY n=1 Tax=Oryza meyeriana var. granulata TaxID=110450 RepID=A0A6G1BYB6_9ORYZ|nr:hypothetical protein E2562_017724 [Oryza meyeriana var. granulata]
MAAVDCAGGRRRFAVACGVLSRCVKAEAAAGKMSAVVKPNSHLAAAASTMLLMPGANVMPDVREEEEAGCGAARRAQQLTIMYGGRVMVFDDFPAESAAELVRVAAGAGQDDVQHGCSGLAADLPVARKASLQRFMEKRRARLGATAPYSSRPSPSPSPFAANAGKEDGDSGCCLVLGTPGSCRAAR